MTKIVKDFLQWKQTKAGLRVSGTVELVLAYVLASLAIDSGSYWQYGLAAIFFIGFIQSFVKARKRKN